MDKATQIELEAATFRRLLKHLQTHTDVQNIDLMILADFCRNCLAKWYKAAALEKNIEIEYSDAQELVYGMPSADWKNKHQRPATEEQMNAFKAKRLQKENA